jgi:hypothetical protein
MKCCPDVLQQTAIRVSTVSTNLHWTVALNRSPRTVVTLEEKQALLGVKNAGGERYAFVEEKHRTAAVGAGKFDHTIRRAASDGDCEAITFLHLPFILAGNVKVQITRIVPAPMYTQGFHGSGVMTLGVGGIIHALACTGFD